MINALVGEDLPSYIESLSRVDDASFSCDESTCGSRLSAMIFFYSYTVLVSIVMLRMAIALILIAFKETSSRENKFMNSELSGHFREVWSEFDPDVSTKRS